MSTIHPNLPSLAESLLSLSAQTKPASRRLSASAGGEQSPPGAAPSTDTLTLAGARQPSDLADAAAQTGQQNQFAALADPAAALAANQSAAAFIMDQPSAALRAQAGPPPQVALGLIQGA